MLFALGVASALIAQGPPIELKEGKVGVVHIAEISSAVTLQGFGLEPVLLAGDEADDTKATPIYQTSGLELGKQPVGFLPNQLHFKDMNDMEGMAWDQANKVLYGISSHSRNKENEPKPARFQLKWLDLAPDSSSIGVASKGFFNALLRNPELKSASEVDPRSRNGNQILNIEDWPTSPGRTKRNHISMRVFGRLLQMERHTLFRLPIQELRSLPQK